MLSLSIFRHLPNMEILLQLDLRQESKQTDNIPVSDSNNDDINMPYSVNEQGEQLGQAEAKTTFPFNEL